MQSTKLAVALSTLAVSGTLALSGCSQSGSAPTLSIDQPAPPTVLEPDSPANERDLTAAREDHESFATVFIDLELHPERSDEPGAAEAERAMPSEIGSPSAGELVELIPNVELGMRLGRILASYPEGAQVVRYFGDTFPPYSVTADGSVEPVAEGGGPLSKVLLSGSYVVSLLGNETVRVDVMGGHDTLIRAGALRVAVPDDTTWKLFDDGGNELYHYQKLTSWYRNPDVGLLPGTYVVEIAGGRVEIEVLSGQITEF